MSGRGLQRLAGWFTGGTRGGGDPAAWMELLLARLMLGAGILFVFYVLQPTLEHGMLAAGDDTIHSAYTLETLRIFKTHGRLFDWTNLYGLGEPIYIFRPPGFYLAVLLLDRLGFGQLPVMFVHKLAYVLALALYPAAIYYMLGKFRLRPLACGIGAMLSFGCISTFGHTLDAYYNLGLAKQAFAILLFPFALGKLHGIVTRGERLLPGAACFGLMFLNHPYMGLAFCMLMGAYVLTLCLARWQWRSWLTVCWRTGAMVAGGLALVGCWLVPFYSSDEIQLTEGYSTSRREGFAIINDTAAGTVRHLLRGSLFDRSPSSNPGDVFGGTSDWGWRPNPGNGRWPVLSWGSLAGAVVLLLRGRRTGAAVLVNLWVLSLMIFMGPDDMRWLLHVPFQEQFQYLHFVPFPELFTICLAAVALEALAVGGWRMAQGVRQRLRVTQAEPVAYVLVTLLCVAPFVGNVWQERLAYSRGRLNNRIFEVGAMEQTAWSLKHPNNVGFKQCTDYLRATLDRFERFYGSPTKVHAGAEIFHFSVAPGFIGRTDLISPLFGGLIGGVNHIVHTGEFRFELWKSAIMLDLLRVGAVVMSTPNEEHFPYDAAVFPERTRFPRWTVYKAEKSGPCAASLAKPVLFVGDARDWEAVCAAWLREVQGLRDRDVFARMPFAVWEREARRDRASAVPLAQFSAVCIADGTLDPEVFFAPGELEAFRAAGGEILMHPTRFHLGLPAWATGRIESGADVPFRRDGDVNGAAAAFGNTDERDGYHAVDVELAEAGLVYLKMAYYRGWRVRVDGEPVTMFSATPGFNACFVPAGKHRVEFEYTGANRQRAGWVVSGVALVTLLGMAICRRRDDTELVPPGDVQRAGVGS